MSTPRVTRAIELRDEIDRLLTAAGLANAVVTLDGRKLNSKAVSRDGGVLITAPHITWPRPDPEGEQVWKVYAVAGPPDRPVAAWSILDRLLDVLAASDLPITEARPAAFDPVEGPPLPAYEATIND